MVTGVQTCALPIWLWPVGIAAFVATVAVGVYLATVSLTVTPDEVIVRQGRGHRGVREILAKNIEDCEVTRFGWAETIGIGPSVPAGTTALVVRPGPGLRLTLNDGEHLHISTPDPAAAARVLTSAGPPSSAGPATIAGQGGEAQAAPRLRPGSGRRD